jgi:hypothetical protein
MRGHERREERDEERRAGTYRALEGSIKDECGDAMLSLRVTGAESELTSLSLPESVASSVAGFVPTKIRSIGQMHKEIRCERENLEWDEMEVSY